MDIRRAAPLSLHLQREAVESFKLRLLDSTLMKLWNDRLLAYSSISYNDIPLTFISLTVHTFIGHEGVFWSL